MGNFKEELQVALGYILGKPLKGNYTSDAEVLHAFNTEMEKKKLEEKQNGNLLE